MTFQAHPATLRRESRDERIDALFAGSRKRWRPYFDDLARQICAFGNEVSIVPGRAVIGFERAGRRFATVAPSAAHLDVGLDCPGVPTVGRFVAAKGWNARVTHRVRIVNQDEDDELVEWLRDAHDWAVERGPGPSLRFELHGPPSILD